MNSIEVEKLIGYINAFNPKELYISKQFASDISSYARCNFLDIDHTLTYDNEIYFAIRKTILIISDRVPNNIYWLSELPERKTHYTIKGPQFIHITEPKPLEVRCDYCGRITKKSNEVCPSCGAVLDFNII